MNKKENNLYPQFHLSLLDFKLNDLDLLNSYQLALVAFHPEAKQIHKLQAESLFLKWRERDRKFFNIGELELLNHGGNNIEDDVVVVEEGELRLEGIVESELEDKLTSTSTNLNQTPPTPRTSEVSLTSSTAEPNQSTSPTLQPKSPSPSTELPQAEIKLIQTKSIGFSNMKGGWTGIKEVEPNTTGQFYQPISSFNVGLGLGFVDVLLDEEAEEEEEVEINPQELSTSNVRPVVIERSISPNSTRRRSTFPEDQFLAISSTMISQQDSNNLILPPSSSPSTIQKDEVPTSPHSVEQRERSESLKSYRSHSTSLPPPPLSPSSPQFKTLPTITNVKEIIRAPSLEEDDMDLETDEEEEEVPVEKISSVKVERIAVVDEEEGSPDVWAQLNSNQNNLRTVVASTSSSGHHHQRRRNSNDEDRSSRHHHDHDNSSRRDRHSKRERSRSRDRDDEDRKYSHRRNDNYSSSKRSSRNDHDDDDDHHHRSSRESRRRDEGKESRHSRTSTKDSSSSRRDRERDEEHHSRSSRHESTSSRKHRSGGHKRDESLSDYKLEDQSQLEQEQEQQDHIPALPSLDEQLSSPIQLSNHYEDNGDIVTRDSTPVTASLTSQLSSVPLFPIQLNSISSSVQSTGTTTRVSPAPLAPAQFVSAQSTLPSPPLSLPLSTSSPSTSSNPSPQSSTIQATPTTTTTTSKRLAPPPPPASIPLAIEKSLLYVHLGGVDPNVSLELLNSFIIRPSNKILLPKPTALVWGGNHTDSPSIGIGGGMGGEKFAYAAYQSRIEVHSVSTSLNGLTMPGIGRMTKTLITNILDECSDNFEWNDLGLDIRLFWESKGELLISEKRIRDSGEEVDIGVISEGGLKMSSNYLKELKRLGLGRHSHTSSSSNSTTSTTSTSTNSNKRGRTSISRSTSLDAIGSVEPESLDPTATPTTTPTTNSNVNNSGKRSLSRKKSRVDLSGSVLLSRTNSNTLSNSGRKSWKSIIGMDEDKDKDKDEVLKLPKEEEL